MVSQASSRWWWWTQEEEDVVVVVEWWRRCLLVTSTWLGSAARLRQPRHLRRLPRRLVPLRISSVRQQQEQQLQRLHWWRWYHRLLLHPSTRGMSRYPQTSLINLFRLLLSVGFTLRF